MRPASRPRLSVTNASAAAFAPLASVVGAPSTAAHFFFFCRRIGGTVATVHWPLNTVRGSLVWCGLHSGPVTVFGSVCERGARFPLLGRTIDRRYPRVVRSGAITPARHGTFAARPAATGRRCFIFRSTYSKRIINHSCARSTFSCSYVIKGSLNPPVNVNWVKLNHERQSH